MDVVLGVAELGEVGLARAIEHGRRAAPVRVGVGVGLGLGLGSGSGLGLGDRAWGGGPHMKTWVCSLG